MNPRAHIERSWQRRGVLAWSLLPLSWLFCTVAWLRRSAYRAGLLRRQRLPVPVIVVGNISVGGTGKTPLVIWLAEQLAARGYRAGVVSRGYGGVNSGSPLRVEPDAAPASVGDEPLLIARRVDGPVVVAPDRVAAASHLLATTDCDLIISDDGLQHYRLHRDLEIVVVDGQRLFGNGFCLPAGPLREPPARLQQVDLVLINGDSNDHHPAMQLVGRRLVAVANPASYRTLDELAGSRVHAVAGIGNPRRFFNQLRAAGVEVIEHPYPDHHRYRVDEIQFNDQLPVIMTEKDAVKCDRIAGDQHWYLRVDASPDTGAKRRLEALLEGLVNG